jgi:CDP-diglyceride synthetase
VTWVYALPLWLLLPLAVAVACAFSLGGLLLARSLAKHKELIPRNDVAGSIFGTIGTVLAVCLSFMFINVWTQYVAASNTVQLEASAASDLHRLADAFPEPARSKMQNAIDRYVQLVIYKEWPQMRSGGDSQAAHDAAYAIQAIVSDFQPKNSEEIMLQSHALDSTNVFLDARRLRLHENDDGIPSFMWATLLFIACVTIVFSYYFRVEKPFEQHLMIVALTSVIVVMMILIADFDYPFRGQTAISSDSWQHTWNSIHHLRGGY